jgi:hypothetical protein
MTRLYGRTLRGRRLLAKAPFGHWKTTTFVAALRRGGLGAPMVLDGPMTVKRQGTGALTHFRCRYARFGGKPDQDTRPWYTDRFGRCRRQGC